MHLLINNAVHELDRSVGGRKNLLHEELGITIGFDEV